MNAEVSPHGLVIGRSQKSADLICSWDSKLSRRHGRVWLEDGKVWYEDLGSSNGSWLDNTRIANKVPLDISREVKLGETCLMLAFPGEEKTVPDNMTVQFRQKVTPGDFTGALKQAGSTSDLLETLASFIDRLLGAADLNEMAPCLQSLYVHLPTAENIYLIEPVEEGGSVNHLIEPAKLARKDATQTGSVSRSLARQAIERGEALLFSEAQAHSEEIQESARLRGIRSAAYVPLLSSDGSALGVLCVDSPQSVLPLHEDNLQLLKSAGALLSARLDGDRLREEAQQREVQTRELEARRKSLADFLKIASHDLKNPLTVIKMCSVLVDKLSSDATVKDLCARLLDAERRAERLISSYLEVSELQSTKNISVRCERLEIRELVENEFEFLRKAYERKDREIELINKCPDVKVYGDRQKVEQILNNLVSNAIKYGDEKPEITVSCEDETEAAVVSVKDNGIGISHEDQRKLFAEFERIGQDQSIPGTGLGLWLTNVLVQAHGGRMSVESDLGVGSTFSFSLPHAPSDAIRRRLRKK